MENDLSLPPNRKKPKGGNYRKKPKGENVPHKKGSAESGISSGFWLLALGLGIGFAVINTLDASGQPNPNDTAPVPTPNGSNTTPEPEPTTQAGTGPAPSTKPTRRAIVAAQRPILFVYINSFGGEGIFDRLKTTATLIDGHGLNRVATLANGEFAGMYTGKYWTGTTRSDGTTPTYIQLYTRIDNRDYNYWVDAGEVLQFHAPGATTHEGYGLGFPMSATTKALIANWYAANYA